MNDSENPNRELLTQLLQCETAVWEALVAGDQQADAAALDSNFLGVYPDGFAGKNDHVQQLTDGPRVEGFELSDHRVVELGDEHALLSYRARFLRRSRNEPESMYVSSIWKRKGDGWTNIFSQDTPQQTEAAIG